MKIPNTPFSTRLSGSAKETELRLRNIFQWKKKRPPVVLFVLTVLVVLLCFGLVSCELAVPEELMDNIEQWVENYPWSEHSENVNEDTRWVVEYVKRPDRYYDVSSAYRWIYEVECRSESGASELRLSLLVDPNTLEIYPEPESWTISGKEAPPQPTPDEPNVEEPQQSVPDEPEQPIRTVQLTGLTLDDDGREDDSLTVLTYEPSWDEPGGHPEAIVRLGTGEELTCTLFSENRSDPKLQAGYLTNLARQSVLICLQSTASNYGYARYHVLGVIDGEVVVTDLSADRETLCEYSLIYHPVTGLAHVQIAVLDGEITLGWNGGAWNEVIIGPDAEGQTSPEPEPTPELEPTPVPTPMPEPEPVRPESSDPGWMLLTFADGTYREGWSSRNDVEMEHAPKGGNRLIFHVKEEEQAWASSVEFQKATVRFGGSEWEHPGELYYNKDLKALQFTPINDDSRAYFYYKQEVILFYEQANRYTDKQAVLNYLDSLFADGRVALWCHLMPGTGPISASLDRYYEQVREVFARYNWTKAEGTPADMPHTAETWELWLADNYICKVDAWSNSNYVVFGYNAVDGSEQAVGYCYDGEPGNLNDALANLWDGPEFRYALVLLPVKGQDDQALMEAYETKFREMYLSSGAIDDYKLHELELIPVGEVIGGSQSPFFLMNYSVKPSDPAATCWKNYTVSEDGWVDISVEVNLSLVGYENAETVWRCGFWQPPSKKD